ncbi:MAG: sulfotransferase [Candidatus Hydrogenedentota bacterium]
MRRLLLLCGIVPVLFVSQTVHWLCFFIDELLFPGYRKIQVKEPLFVVGVPRSGTTYFHRLLSGDEGRFTTMTLGEIYLAPSIIQRRIFRGLGRVDAALGGFGRKAVDALDRRFFRKLKNLHPQSLFKPDEDEQVLSPIFCSASLAFVFPFESEMAHLIRFDDDVPPRLRRDIMWFYKKMIQRHMYVHGPEKYYLSKSPSFSVKLRSIRETFPDAKAVCNVRSPYECIPSLASLGKFYWDAFGNTTKGDRFRDSFMEISHSFYQAPMNVLPEWPENQYAFLLYPDLMAHPKTCVEDIYARFGWSISREYERFLAEQERKQKQYKSKHVYNMEDHGVTPAMLLEYMRDVFDFYGFPTDTDAA